MATALKVITTTSPRLPELPVADGNLVFVRDICKMYFDINGNRCSYDTIMNFETEQERQDFATPLEGFYYVEESNVLWRYKDEWIQVSSSGATPIFFGEYEDFPQEGRSTVIYVASNATYRWNPLTKEYDIVANKTAWENLENL